MLVPPGQPGHVRLAEVAGVASPDRRALIADVIGQIESAGLHSVRVSFADVHGLLRGKTLRADLIADAFADGVGITSALLLKDTGQRNVYPVWAQGGGLDQPWLTGAGDVMMIPDPSTFRILPWAPGTGWLLCDIFGPRGEPIAFSTRSICRTATSEIREHGYELRAGLEVEFHLYQMAAADDTIDGSTAADALDLRDTHPGRAYLSETRFDLIEPFLELLRADLTELGLAPRSLEVELGPSQVELTFSPAGAFELADQAVLLRSAVKQIARRHGLHATFMSRPHFANAFTSGWHLHQSLIDSSGANVFATDPNAQTDDGSLSDVGGHYLNGILAHAGESCLLTTPTITGYKRYRSESLAPLRAAWAPQHRGAMLRVIGTPGSPATRIENRIGDSAANPYLYVASQIQSGLAGLDAGVAPRPATNSPYDDDAGPLLPATLGSAVDAFTNSSLYRKAFGHAFVDYLCGIKAAEWARFIGTVTDWEQTEYLELF